MGEVEERRKGFSSAGSWRDIRPPDPLMGEIEKLLDNFFLSQKQGRFFLKQSLNFGLLKTVFYVKS